MIDANRQNASIVNRLTKTLKPIALSDGPVLLFD